MNKSDPKYQEDFIIVENRRASLNYSVLKSFEAGIVLVGSEVKSLRNRQCQLKDSYLVLQHGEAYLQHLHISPYKPAAEKNHHPERKRKLLLHAQELKNLIGQLHQKGLSCIPLKIYFKHSKVKVQIALVKGKKKGDKREYIKKKEMKRATQKAVRRDR